MAYYNMNKIIRLARIAQNIKQEELCSNLCSVGTLSRFENGRLSLKPRLLAALAEKLGISDSVADIVSDSFDPEWQRLRNLYTSAKFRSNLAEEEQHLLSLKKYASTLLQKQYVASEDARLCFCKHKISVKEEQILIDKAIRMTVPDYDKHLDKPFPFTLDECKYLLCLGNTYNDSKPEENEKALSLYHAILRSIDEGYMWELLCQGRYSWDLHTLLIKTDNALHSLTSQQSFRHATRPHLFLAQVLARFLERPGDHAVERERLIRECRMLYFSFECLGQIWKRDQIAAYCLEKTGEDIRE